MVGLVGGVGSGKSSIARAYASRVGGYVVDADAIGHRVLDEPAIQRRIRERFGETVFDENGQIHRSALARRVFGDSSECRQARRDLEAIVHPRIKEVAQQEIAHARQSGKYNAVLLDAAVLLEAGWQSVCDTIVFVETPLEVRIQRVTDSRGWDADELARRESSQYPLDVKRASADLTLNNSGAVEDAAAELERLLSTSASCH